MKKLIGLLAIASVAFSQDGAPVVVSIGPPLTAFQSLLYFSGSNVIYICKAPSRTTKTSTITVSAASNASPVSFTATAHGFGDFATLGATSTPVVKITGYTGNWAPVNGVWSIITTSADAFTIAVDTTTFGAVTGTAVFTTMAPLWNQPIWAIQHFVYDGSSNLIFSGWAANNLGAGNSSLVGGSSGLSYKCSTRTTYGYQ